MNSYVNAECRDKFDVYEQKVFDRSGNTSYRSHRKPKRKNQFDEGNAADAMEGMTERQKFKINTFAVIIDQLNSVFNKCIEAYSTTFGFLTEFDSCLMMTLRLQLQ